MSQKTKSILLQALPVITIATLLVVAIIYAWTEPGSAPPAGNVPAPINVGNSAQIKSGPLQVNGFRNIGNTILDGNVGIGTTIPGAKLEVQGGDLKVGGATIRSDGSVVLNPQTTPPGNPTRGQIYFDANSNQVKIHDGSAWKYLDSGYQIYMDSPIGYAGASHIRQDCVNAGGSITTIFGKDGSNTDLCKFTASSCPSGWTQAGSWNTYISGSGGSGGDVCGNVFSGTSCTTSGVSWSNSGPPASCSFTNCYKTTFIQSNSVHDTQSNLNTRQGSGGIGSIACPICSANSRWCDGFGGGCNSPEDCFVYWSEWSYGCSAATASPTRTEIGCK